MPKTVSGHANTVHTGVKEEGEEEEEEDEAYMNEFIVVTRSQQSPQW